MAQTSSTERTWSEMQFDMLIKIFMCLDIVDLGNISLVCKSWKDACSDPVLWNKVDLSKMKSGSFIIPNRPYSWADEQSSAKLNRILRNVFNLSNGNITCLIFHFFLYINDVHLLTVAQRSPNLKRLVLPGWSHLSEMGIHNAMQYWRNLESMTIPSILNPYSMMEAIGKYCKNFKELKITCHFNVGLANALIRNIPNLKVLSLRCMVLNKEALVLTLNSLKHLEILNICHSLVMLHSEANRNITMYRQSEVPNIVDKSLLKKLITCKGDNCIRCRHASLDSRKNQWFRFQELLWGEDEVASLAC